LTNEPTASTVTVNLDHPMCVTSDEGDRSYVTSTISKPISNNLNTKAVWGAISAGIGQFPLEEVFALMDLPVVSKNIFRKTETLLGQVRIRQCSVHMICVFSATPESHLHLAYAYRLLLLHNLTLSI
jgi:hypothetical protein